MGSTRQPTHGLALSLTVTRCIAGERVCSMGSLREEDGRYGSKACSCCVIYPPFQLKRSRRDGVARSVVRLPKIYSESLSASVRKHFIQMQHLALTFAKIPNRLLVSCLILRRIGAARKWRSLCSASFFPPKHSPSFMSPG
jgi:hypothetical protein